MTFGSVGLTSCDDFLTILPTDQLPEENFWKEKSDLESVLAGAYEQLSESGMTSKILIWGELRADNMQLNDMTQTNLSYLQDAVLQPNLDMFDWSGFYKGINYCNLILEQGELMTEPDNEVDPSFTRSDWTGIRSEILALRALYYFYLVRAFRDVPYVTESIRTDAQAEEHKPYASPGVAILGELIDQLEEAIGSSPTNYGNTADNKGRFTRWSTHALLADMYLWRGCMLMNFMDKTNAGAVNLSDVATEGGTYTTTDGVTIDETYCNSLAQSCFAASREHCQAAIDHMKEEYDEDYEKNPYLYPAEDAATQPYPLYLIGVRGGNGGSDTPYSYNFGTQNSDESLFELQYDGSSTINSTVNTYFTKYSNAELQPQYFTLSNTLLQGVSSADPEVGWGMTDIRLWETCNYGETEGNKPIAKFVVRSLYFSDLEDLVSDASTNSVYDSYRSESSNDAHWPVYRLADVMLIEAEAIARLESPTEDDLKEGFQLVNQLFKRNNPALIGPGENGYEDAATELKNDRVGENYGVNASGTFTPTASDLLALTYRERQREFVGEGKRWFDIVRQAESVYSSSENVMTSVSSFISVKTTVRTRLSRLYSLYNPIYSEELKVNPNLEQNPIWERYTKN